jgi:hypothetical protein
MRHVRSLVNPHALQLMVDCATLGSEEGVAAAGGRVVLGAAAPEIDCCYDAHCWGSGS